MRNRQAPKHLLKLLIHGIIAILTSLYILVLGVQSYASTPSAALITNAEGNELRVRQGTNHYTEPVQRGHTRLERYEDILYVPGDESSWAALEFLLGQSFEHGGLLVRTIPQPMESEYRFPCRAGGSFLIAWRAAGSRRDRACGEGIIKILNRRTKRAWLRDIFSSILAQADKSFLKDQEGLDEAEIVISPGQDQTIVQVIDSGFGIEIIVLLGEVTIKPINSPEANLKTGQKYSYPQNSVTDINRNQIVQSRDVQDFLDPNQWSSPDVPQKIADQIATQLEEARAALGLGVQAAKECHGKEILSAKTCAGDELEPEEAKLYQMINQYRSQNGLPPIPSSKSLTLVANRHVRDISENISELTHSWSNCPYDTNVPDTWSCMWTAPQRLKTAYPGNGYENAHGGSGGFVASAETALQSWQDGSYHQEVILNQGIWKDRKWNALGIGIYKGYGVMWVGEEPDPAN